MGEPRKCRASVTSVHAWTVSSMANVANVANVVVLGVLLNREENIRTVI